jgi:hypothetical protein
MISVIMAEVFSVLSEAIRGLPPLVYVAALIGRHMTANIDQTH